MQKMGNMNINPGPEQRPRTAAGPGNQGDFAPPSRAAKFENRPSSRSGNRGDFPPPSRAATFDDRPRPSLDGPPSRAATFDDRPRASLDSQRRPPVGDLVRPSNEQQRPGPPGGYADQPQAAPQNFSQPKRPPQLWNQSAAFGSARNKAYWDAPFANGDSFGPPSRSNTMPNDIVPPSNMQSQRAMEDPGTSAPYNGPVGRNMPPRPSTATGTRPPPPQNQYAAPTPIAPQQAFVDNFDEQDPRRSESISELYDSYYDEQDRYDGQRHSGQSDTQNYGGMNNGSNGKQRGGSVDQHMNSGPVHQQGGYQRPVQQHTDHRALAEPQAAVFESASDGQRTPTNANFFQRDQYDDYGAPGNQYDRPRSNEQYDQRAPSRGQQYNQPPPGQYDSGYPNQRAPSQNSYNEPQQNGFQPPPRSTSAAPRMGQGPPFNNPPPPAVGPKPTMNGAYNGQPMNGGMQRNTSAGSNHSMQQPYNNDPSHPVPVRPGLIPGSVASQNANIKPVPVRNYNNMNGPAGVNVQPPPQQQQQQQQPQQQPQKQPHPAPATSQQPQGLTQSQLEHVRKAANANPNDAALQMLLIKKLVEASEVLVNSYPDVRMRNKMREKHVMDASKMLKRLVAGNNTDAMFYLADCYGRGALGLENNDKEAFNLYQSAAKAGHAAAAYRTAVCCELGSEDGGGTKKDPLKAIQWYKRSATLGDTPAMYKMGMIQLKGLLGQQKNIKEAVQWLKRAAERADAENPHALHELGLLYEAPQSADGSIVRDEAYSLKLFKQAADLGYKFSQFRLGCAYEYGLLGLAIDARQSIAWYSRAAVQEEHQSELALSGWYLTGSEGVLQQSDTEAYLWARKAAMAGLAKAEYAMGYFTEVGIGSQANLEDAKRWYWRAAGMFFLHPQTFSLWNGSRGEWRDGVLICKTAQNFPKARERLEDLKKNGGKAGARQRERISRSTVGKHNEGECAVM